MTRRTKARLLAGLGIVAGVVLLAACSKPAPNITVQSGTKSVIVEPSTYCFDSSDCRKQGIDVPTITVGPNQNVLVDVPRKVLDNGWAMVWLDVDGKTSLGNSGKITKSHSYRLAAGAINNGNPFIAQVWQLDGNKGDGSKWSFIVAIDPTKS